MASSTVDLNTPMKPGDVVYLPLVSGATVYHHTMVCSDASGWLVDGINTAGFKFQGVAMDAAGPATANGSHGVRVAKCGVWDFICSGLSQADVGKDVFLSYNQTVTLTATNIYVGKLSRFSIATVAHVDIEHATRGSGRNDNSIFVISAHQGGEITHAAKTLMDDFEMPVPFKVLRGYATAITAPGGSYVCTVTITDGATPKTVTITGTATKGENEAIDTTYAANTNIDITAIDDNSSGATADLNVWFVCQQVGA